MAPVMDPLLRELSDRQQIAALQEIGQVAEQGVRVTLRGGDEQPHGVAAQATRLWRRDGVQFSRAVEAQVSCFHGVPPSARPAPRSAAR